MSEKEMIEILQMNDEDQTGDSLIHPNVEIRLLHNKRSKYEKSITEKQNSRKGLRCAYRGRIALKEKKLYEKLLPGLDVVAV